jgi:hypothetical protein
MRNRKSSMQVRNQKLILIVELKINLNAETHHFNY